MHIPKQKSSTNTWFLLLIIRSGSTLYIGEGKLQASVKKQINLHKDDLEFNSGNLYYSIQKSKVQVNELGFYIMEDTYDFTEIRDWNSFANLLNNYGNILQQLGILKPYNIKIIFKAEDLYMLEGIEGR